MLKSTHLDEMMQECQRIAEVHKGDTHKLAAHLWQLGVTYMEDVRKRARYSFISALVISLLGIGFFFYALRLMLSHNLPFSRLTLIAGVSIQVVSGIGFYLHGKTQKEFFAFHVCLERANRYLLANTICDNLSDDYRDKVRSKLVRRIAGAPPLSMSLVEAGESVADKLEPEVSPKPAATDFSLSASRN
jgi:hypothetical protein